MALGEGDEHSLSPQKKTWQCLPGAELGGVGEVLQLTVDIVNADGESHTFPTLVLWPC